MNTQTVSEQSQSSAAGRTSRRRSRIGFAMITAGGLILLAGLWIGVTALLARNQLNQVTKDAHSLDTNISASDWSAARATAADLATHAHRADQLTSGPVWALAAALPSGGEPLQTIRGITAGVDSLSRDALPQLISACQQLNPRTLREPNGSINVARIAAVTPAVTSATDVVAQTTETISALPRHTWLHAIDTSSAQALTQVTTLNNTLKSADLAARILPAMLGQSGPQRYLLVFQNDAEARGTGGLPGAFAIIEANHGKLTVTSMESDNTLNGTSASVNLVPDYSQLYNGAETTSLYINGNLSPNFPYAAQIWASMWKNYSGQKVNGVIAVDPTALSYLLDVTGPAALPDNSQISGANAVALTQSTSYAMFPGTDQSSVAQRKAYELEIATVASKKILSTRSAPTALLSAASKAAGQRRLLVWSADPAVEANLAQTSVSGIIPTTPAPYVGLSIVNDGGNKLDYYLDRSLTWQTASCGATRPTTVTITLTNNAPASGLSPYVTDRSDIRSYPIKVGDNRLDVSYFATQGALMTGVTVAGQPGTASIGTQLGHPVYTVDLELPRGTSRTIVLHLIEPVVGTSAPIVLYQPLVRPLHVTLTEPVCN